jgi:hypothetical protein
MILFDRDSSLTPDKDYDTRISPALAEDEDAELVIIDNVEMWEVFIRLPENSHGSTHQ